MQAALTHPSLETSPHGDIRYTPQYSPKMDQYHYKQQCNANYNDLLNNILSPMQPGIARCKTPIKPSRVAQIVRWMEGLGLEPHHMIKLGDDGIERVILTWDASRQKDLLQDIS